MGQTVASIGVLYGNAVPITYSLPDSIEPREQTNRYDLEKSEVIVYPNPSTGLIHIEGLTEIHIPAIVYIYSANGILHYQFPINSYETTLNLDRGYSNGVYIMQLITNDGNITNLKFVLNRM